MTIVRVVGIVAAVLVVAWFTANRHHPTTLPEGAVVKVVDGDTITVAGYGKVRILLIDAPETHDNDHNAKGCYGETAKAFLSDLLPVGRPVTLVTDRALRDRYGRLLAYVEADGVDVGRQVLAAGLAKTAYYRPNDARLDDYIGVEERARSAGLGIWGPVCRP